MGLNIDKSRERINEPEQASTSIQQHNTAPPTTAPPLSQNNVQGTHPHPTVPPGCDNNKIFSDLGVLAKNITEEHISKYKNLDKQFEWSIKIPTTILDEIHHTLDGDKPPAEKAEILFQNMHMLKNMLAKDPDEMTFAIFEQLKQISKDIKALQKVVADPAINAKLSDIRKEYHAIIGSNELFLEFKQIKAEAKILHEWENRPNKEWFDKPPQTPLLNLFKLIILEKKSNEDSDAVKALHTYDSNTVGLTKEIMDKAKWSDIRSRMWKAQVQNKPFFAQGKKITWVTGSKSSSIPGIMRAAQTDLSKNKKPTLAPTRLLMKHNIVPLAGEMSGGIHPLRGVNLDYLSGVHFNDIDVSIAYASAKGYQFNLERELEVLNNFVETPIKYALDEITRARVAMLRLCLMGHPIPEDLLNKINGLKHELLPSQDWKNYHSLIGQKVDIVNIESRQKEDFKSGEMVAIRKPHLAPGRLEGDPDGYEPNPNGEFVYAIVRQTNSQGDPEIIFPNPKPDGQPITLWVNQSDVKPVEQNELNKQAAGLTSAPGALPKVLEEFAVLDSYLDAIVSIPTQITPAKMSYQEQKHINNPYPIVWASVSVATERFHGKEVLVKGAVELGKDRDIQYVFTHRDNVQALQVILDDHQVEVMSFDAGILISARQQLERQREADRLAVLEQQIETDDNIEE